MKKLITLLLVLTGMVTTASATTWTVAGSSTELFGTAWTPSLTENDMTEANGICTWSKTNVSLNAGSFEFKVCKDHEWDEAYPAQDYSQSIPGSGTYDVTITFNLDTKDVACTLVAVINTVTFSYGKSGEDWANLALEDADNDGTYTATLDLSTTSDNQNFKLVINGSWLGTNEFTLASGSLGTLGTNDTDELTLDNKSYKTYTISATWVSNSDATKYWTLSIAGVTARGSNTYTVTFNNHDNWSNVYAYTFGPELCGGWPGTAMTPNGDGTYSLSFTDYEPYQNSSETSQLIFNNNNDKQTKNLTLIDNHTYSMNPKYFVVGNKDFLGNWDSASELAEMTFVENGDEDYYTFSANAQVLNSNIEYKIKQQLYDEQTNFDLYPADNRTISIPVAGKYNIAIRFNSYWQNWSDDNIASGTATKTHDPVTITDAGWATTFTNSALDFSGETDFEAYTATVSGTTVTLTKVNDVPAETGLVLKLKENKTPDTFYVPIAESSSTPKGSLRTSDGNYKTNDTYAYCYGLVVESGIARFAKINHDQTIPAGKAFIEIIGATGARELAVVFADESTGIEAVKNIATENNAIYNLAGQRVVAPAKGLYIVNGKKVMMK